MAGGRADKQLPTYYRVGPDHLRPVRFGYQGRAHKVTFVSVVRLTAKKARGTDMRFIAKIQAVVDAVKDWNEDRKMAKRGWTILVENRDGSFEDIAVGGVFTDLDDATPHGFTPLAVSLPKKSMQIVAVDEEMYNVFSRNDVMPSDAFAADSYGEVWLARKPVHS